VLSQIQYSFLMTPPRIAYLAPSDGASQNIWLVDLTDLTHPKQITHSTNSIYDYSASPDGTQIAYAERDNATGTADLKLLDIDSGVITQLTYCQTAMCTTPAWRPDGQMIAYERAENDPQFCSSPVRIWLLDLSVSPPTTKPLFADGQRLGYGAQWSADGSRISLLDSGSASLLVYDFKTQKTFSVATQNGSPGVLSPDGKNLLYAEMTFDESNNARTTLRSALVDMGLLSLISDVNGQTNDQVGEWSPDGTQIAIGRQDSTQAHGIQIVLLDLRTNQTSLLTQDPRYSNISFAWDPTGTQLVIYRFPELGEDMKPDALARPQIWTLDVASKALQELANNAFKPNWVP
jgi:Tol biopolymer transport system component